MGLIMNSMDRLDSAMGVIYHYHISWISYISFQLAKLLSRISSCQLTNTVRMQVAYSTSRKTTQGACAGANSVWGWGQRRTDHSRLSRWCQRRRLHLSALREWGHLLSTSVPWGAGGRLTLQCICYHTNCHTIFALRSFTKFLNFQIAGVWYHTSYHGMILSVISWVYDIISSWYHRSRIMISYMISWSRIWDIVYDIICLWYHMPMIS